MKGLLTAAAIALLTTTAAHAAPTSKPFTMYKGGFWETYAMASNSDGVPMCGMQTVGNASAFYVKWTSDAGMVVQVAKASWRLPKDAKVNFQLEFIDNATDDTITITTEHGWVSQATGASVFMGVKDEDRAKFLQAFGDADRIKLNFLEGDEPSWGMKMEGSRKAAAEFSKCVRYLGEQRGTSPVAKSKPTSPIAPTQPTAKATPTQPTSPTSPAKKPVAKDDGSV